MAYTKVSFFGFAEDFDSFVVESRFSKEGERFQFVNCLDENEAVVRTLNFPKDLGKVDCIPVGASNQEVADAIAEQAENLTVLKTTKEGSDEPYYVVVSGSADYEAGAKFTLKKQGEFRRASPQGLASS